MQTQCPWNCFLGVLHWVRVVSILVSKYILFLFHQHDMDSVPQGKKSTLSRSNRFHLPHFVLIIGIQYRAIRFLNSRGGGGGLQTNASSLNFLHFSYSFLCIVFSFSNTCTYLCFTWVFSPFNSVCNNLKDPDELFHVLHQSPIFSRYFPTNVTSLDIDIKYHLFLHILNENKPLFWKEKYWNPPKKC